MVVFYHGFMLNSLEKHSSIRRPSTSLYVWRSFGSKMWYHRFCRSQDLLRLQYSITKSKRVVCSSTSLQYYFGGTMREKLAILNHLETVSIGSISFTDVPCSQRTVFGRHQGSEVASNPWCRPNTVPCSQRTVFGRHQGLEATSESVQCLLFVRLFSLMAVGYALKRNAALRLDPEFWRG